jgi:Rhodopirellula transposase DDE domain
VSCIVALRATCSIQHASGWRVMPPHDTRRLPTSMKNRMRTPTVISPGRGSGPRAQSWSWSQARGKKTPEIIDAIEILLEHDTAGDPITGLKWTRKTTEKIAEVLQQIDIPVSANTVSRLLYQMHFSLRVNRKQIATNSSPYRDQQFQHICSLRTRFQRQGLPVMSVDSKKREMIGNFKNGGAKWDRAPLLAPPRTIGRHCQKKDQTSD